MTYPTTMAAAHWSSLAVSVDAAAVATALAAPTEINLKAAFATISDYEEIKNIRDMPQFGNPSNIVNVPVYGRGITASVNAQADAPSLELTINYIPSLWAPSTVLGGLIGAQGAQLFQFAFLTSQAVDFATDPATGNLGDVPNAVTYFVGKLENILVTPARDDAATATISISIQSPFYGAFTVTTV
jgi:hypothetical protein